MKASPVVRLPGWMATEISAKVREHNECGAVILAGISHDSGVPRLMCREIHWVPDDAYDRRTPRALAIRSWGYMNALGRAEERGDIPIWMHTHPGGDLDPRRSKHDVKVDAELSETFRIRSGADTYASLVFSPSDDGFAFTGIAVNARDEETAIGRIVVLADRWRFISAADAPSGEQLPIHFDRQVRAFGGDMQRTLAHLRIGIVGSGGTGSATAEQLARLGVGSLLLIDPKALSESNPTRVYGSSPGDIGEPKAAILASYLRGIAPMADIEAVIGTVTDESVARRLTSCDVVFGCTDDNAGRLILSRLPTYYMIPVIDMGVLISSHNGTLDGIDGRVTIVNPGSTCLVCRNRVDLARAGAEQLSPDERRSRQAEGYAPELGAVEPAVITYTTAVASFAVAELLERLIGYGPDQEPGEILLRFHDREISTNTASPKLRHYCDPATGLVGAGDRNPFLGQTWRG